MVRTKAAPLPPRHSAFSRVGSNLAVAVLTVHAERLKARRHRAARTVQRAYRAHLLWRYRNEWRRHRAASLVQARWGETVERRQAAAMQIQRGLRPRIDEFMAQRAEAKRLARELQEMLEKQRNDQARAAFAHRFDATGRDFDEDEGHEEDAMEDYLHSLRAAAGLSG